MKILVPVDFSELSEKAIEVAAVFAKLFGGKISLFHSHIPISELDEPYGIGLSSKIYEDYEQIESTLKERLDAFAREKADSSVLDESLVTIGNPAQAIIDASKDFDYIIISTHGRTGFSRFVLGSVAEKVLRLAHTPVMVVEDDSDVGEFKKIMVTTDFSENAATSYPYAVNIAKATGASVDLIHILSFEQFDDEDTDISLKENREERLKLIEKEYFHDVPGQVNRKVITSPDSPHEAIFNYVKNNPYNLIVMATVGRTGINYLMMGSTTANVVRHVNTAVLSINPKKS